MPMRQIVNALTLAILGLLIFVVAPNLPAAEDAGPLSIEGPPYRVWVSHQTECCPKQVELRVREDGSEEDRSLELTGRMQKLQELRPVIDPRVLLIGDLRYGGTNLWIVNLETLRHETEIWTYGHGISPSGRYLAYQTHYPGMALPADRRSIFLLYDLSMPPEKNRSGPAGDQGDRTLGTPIFPEKNAAEPSWSTAGVERSYSLSSPFLWSDDERVLVFLVVGRPTGTDERQGFVVRVELTPEGRVREVSSELLTRENVEAPYETASSEEPAHPHLLVTLDTLEWSKERGEGWVVGETALPGDTLGSKVWIRLP